MNERDVMALLANANPVHEQDLTPVDVPRFARRAPNRRLIVAIAIAVVVAAAALTAALAFNGSNSSQRLSLPRGPRGLLGPTGAAGATGANGATGGNGPTGLQGATGANGSTSPQGPSGALGPTGANSRGIWINVHRSGGVASAVHVTLTGSNKYGIRVRVRYLGPRGDYISPYLVVYQTHIAATGVARIWSHTLHPDQWRGGCRRGDYEVDYDSYDGNRFVFGGSSDNFLCDSR